MANESDQVELKRIAANLRRLRGTRSLSEVASMVDTFPASIKRIEDAHHMPGAGLLKRLADAFGVTVDSLYADTKKRKLQAS